MNLSDDATFTPSENVTWRKIDNDNIVVLKLETGEYFTFNDLGRILWQEFAADKTFAQIVQTVVDTYDVDKTQAKNDIMNFAARLLQDGVLAE